MTLSPGLTHESSWTVEERHLASALGSGVAPVFGTPSLVALCEMAAFNAVAPYLPAGQSTVGTHVDIRHLAATPLGMTVRAVATLVSVDRRALNFTVEAYDEKEKIGEGKHQRFIIDEARFLEKSKGKRQKAKGKS